MKLPVFNELEKAETVLLAGAGGGFDIYSGIPLYCWLKSQGKKVHLASLTFTDLTACKGERPVPSLLKVMPDTWGPLLYFPELYLAQWMATRYEPAPVYAIERAGARPVAAAYQWLVEELKPDTLILIDGGTDSLMRGDEIGLGTPEEDMASLYAAHTVKDVARKLLICIGFGVDTFHGVCHAHFLENVAALIAEGGYLGTWSLMREMEEFQLYREACGYAQSRMSHHPSIVNTSILTATEGWYGDRHSTERTHGSELFINPLMPLYWSFQLEHVARRNLYMDRIAETSTWQELSIAIGMFHARQTKLRPWTDLPV